jgi:hypothetical protein
VLECLGMDERARSGGPAHGGSGQLFYGRGGTEREKKGGSGPRHQGNEGEGDLVARVRCMEEGGGSGWPTEARSQWRWAAAVPFYRAWWVGSTTVGQLFCVGPMNKILCEIFKNIQTRLN